MKDEHIITKGKPAKPGDTKSRIGYLFAASPAITEASIVRKFIDLPSVRDTDVAVLQTTCQPWRPRRKCSMSTRKTAEIGTPTKSVFSI